MQHTETNFKKLRIAIVTNEFPSISETFISNQVKFLAAKGNEIFVFCFSKNFELLQQLFNNNKQVRIIVFNSRVLIKYFFLHPFQSAKTFSRSDNSKLFFLRKARVNAINSCSPDIVHFEFSGIGILFLNEINNILAKTIVSCRGSAEKVKLLVDNTRKKNLEKLFDNVNAIHCVSADMMQTILPYCKLPGKIFINFPSIDTDLFKRQNPYAEHDVINIISVGRITFQKGYLIGLLAIKRLKDAGIKFKWTIIGKGPKMQELFFHINEMDLQNEVTLMGAQPWPDVIAHYQQADIYFLPSFYEGIANAVLEAMSMELPVVSTKSGGMQEVITNNADGFLADVYDDNALAILLIQLSNNFQLRRQTGIAARKKIVDQFNIHLQTNKYQQVYNKLIQE